MSVPPIENGKYLIIPSSLLLPTRGIGADDPSSRAPGDGAAVILNGTHQIWIVERQSNGTYKLFLEGGGHSIDGPECTIWVNMSIPTGREWHIEMDPVYHSHLITSTEDSPRLLWTLLSPQYEDKAPVFLRPVEESYMQRWLFFPQQ